MYHTSSNLKAFSQIYSDLAIAFLKTTTTNKTLIYYCSIIINYDTDNFQSLKIEKYVTYMEFIYAEPCNSHSFISCEE